MTWPDGEQFTMTDAQAMRLAYAMEFTREHMAECGVPVRLRDRALVTLQREMLAAFRLGEQTPNAPTEAFWRLRAVSGYSWKPNTSIDAAGNVG